MPYMDQSQILAGGQALVPDYLEQDLRRRLGAAQIENYASEAAKDRAAINEQQQFQQAWTALQDNPSPQAWAALAARFPKMAQGLKAAHELQTGTQQQSDRTRLGEMYSAGKGGHWDLVEQSLQQRIDADRAAGADVGLEASLLEDVKSGDPVRRERAMNMIGTEIAMSMGAEHFAATYGALGLKPEERGAREKDYDFYLRTLGKDAADAWARGEADPTKWIPLTEGGKVVPVRPGDAERQPASSALPQAPTPLTPATGLSNVGALNNPGGLKDGAFARSQPGYKGRKGEFAVFETQEQGIAAQEALLRARYLRKPITIRQLIERYAPRRGRGGDNSNASVDNYIAHVSQRTGIPADQPVTAAYTAPIAAAMREFETGQRGAGGPPRVRSIQEAMRLPPGTIFFTPDGRRKVR